ncbi:PREDICTED: uncharacterized protein LOC107171626 [Diuraphis noxia]|uniref:uncharacterized protein LOC107171626 n=1 Tax=Diuraphis noxia TaxID=143948 RepID=UPI000763B5F7|nr:PREDICTED: uncharacterized protein LOC107171626 [Diuraphis noxia]
MISRGKTTEELVKCKLWWQGPSWITKDSSEWPVIPSKLPDDETILERKKVVLTLTVSTSSMETSIEFIERLISQFSKLRTLINVTARLLRLGKRGTRTSTLCSVIPHEALTPGERDFALKRLILLTQQHAYKAECNSLTTHNRIVGKSVLVQLHPFLDANNLLRVGGRLQQSSQPYDSKHPLILPGNNSLSNLIIEDTHHRLLHAGPTQLIATLRQRFWIIGVKRAASKIIWRCLKCYRWKASRSKQLMGSLPESRVTVAAPFSTCGVDYAGPFTTRIGPPRSKKTTKSYIALFICFVSKAIHIELVSDLTTEAFISAVKRFVSRRRCPSEINSDNGRNFVGTANVLKAFLNDNRIQKEILEYATDQQLTWKFIPPHMGGLWEAGIKSAKHHLKRVVGETIMSFEELSTILCQIEAVLNSRLLAPMYDDVESLDVLTPAHFLIGKPLRGRDTAHKMFVKTVSRGKEPPEL